MPGKTLREQRIGGIRLRLVQRENGGLAGRYWIDGGRNGTVFADSGETEQDFSRRLLETALKDDPSFLGYEGAIARFIDRYPMGFEDAGFLEVERNYKVRARNLLNKTVPVNEAAREAGFKEDVVRVTEDLNLVDPGWERPALIAALRSQDGDALVQHCANFALGDWGRLSAIAVICKSHGMNVKWPIATYLPFLWETAIDHVVLRRQPTTRFAGQVGHAFKQEYESDLRASVYESLLDLFAQTKDEIASLKPRDIIDVQSFVWVVSTHAK